METKKENPNKISKEANEINEIEEEIQNMLNKVMEENEQSSFIFDDDEIEDESFKISRHSTRHQSTANPVTNLTTNSNKKSKFFNGPNFNRDRKRNYTVNSNHATIPSFNNPNFPLIKNPSFGLSNNGNNNFIPNFYNNPLKNVNNNNIIFGFNNNLNQSFQSYHSFNPQFSNNFLNESMDKNNFIRNSMPYSKTVVYHNNQGNIFDKKNNNNIQLNKIFYELKNNNNIPMTFNGNNNIEYFPINIGDGFKRGENRKKTYDTSINFQNNIINCLKGNTNINNNVCINRQKEEQLLNNFYFSSIDNNIYNNNTDNINNNEYINNINNDKSHYNIYENNNKNINNNAIINDNYIYELKNLLEKNEKIDYSIYNLIKGKIILIIKNHKGSKILQKFLKSTNHSDEIIHLIFLEISLNLEELMTDPYANYFCKKFFSNLNLKDRIDFLKRIEKSLVPLSLDSIGTYPIQTIIEHLSSNIEKMIIISSIKERIEELIFDPFGVHVLEKILACFEDEYIMFIYSYIFENFLIIANNNNGICVIKKILTFTHKKNLHENLKNLVKKNALDLIHQSYGNFVIQIIVECWDDYKDIVDLFKAQFFNLSLEKYSSNVIERCLEKSKEILIDYIDEIIKSKCIYQVMKSHYGNYVIQKVIKLSEGEYKNKFVFTAAKEINKLNDNKLIRKWKSILIPHIKELSPQQIQELKSNNFFK